MEARSSPCPGSRCPICRPEDALHDCWRDQVAPPASIFRAASGMEGWLVRRRHGGREEVEISQRARSEMRPTRLSDLRNAHVHPTSISVAAAGHVRDEGCWVLHSCRSRDRRGVEDSRWGWTCRNARPRPRDAEVEHDDIRCWRSIVAMEQQPTSIGNSDCLDCSMSTRKRGAESVESAAVSWVKCGNGDVSVRVTLA